MTKSAWTQEDEDLFKKLIVRREMYKKETERPLNDFVSKNWLSESPCSMTNLKTVCNWLIANAAQFRDLLAPFDNRLPPDGIK